MRPRFEKGWVIQYEDYYYCFFTLDNDQFWAGARCETEDDCHTLAKHKVGQRIEENQWCGDIDEIVDFGEHWEYFRLEFLDGMLGEPDYQYKSTPKIENICTCDNRSIMLHGCPSNRGEKCPGRKWISYY